MRQPTIRAIKAAVFEIPFFSLYTPNYFKNNQNLNMTACPLECPAPICGRVFWPEILFWAKFHPTLKKQIPALLLFKNQPHF
jgi:hypothetical protein